MTAAASGPERPSRQPGLATDGLFFLCLLILTVLGSHIETLRAEKDALLLLLWSGYGFYRSVRTAESLNAPAEGKSHPRGSLSRFLLFSLSARQRRKYNDGLTRAAHVNFIALGLAAVLYVAWGLVCTFFPQLPARLTESYGQASAVLSDSGLGLPRLSPVHMADAAHALVTLLICFQVFWLALLIAAEAGAARLLLVLSGLLGLTQLAYALMQSPAWVLHLALPACDSGWRGAGWGAAGLVSGNPASGLQAACLETGWGGLAVLALAAGLVAVHFALGVRLAESRLYALAGLAGLTVMALAGFTVTSGASLPALAGFHTALCAGLGVCWSRCVQRIYPFPYLPAAAGA